MPLLKKLRSALTKGLPPHPSPGGSMATGRDLERLKRAEAALSQVIVPGYDVDLVTSGVVKKLRLTREGQLLVFLDYTGSDPHCNFCRFINWQLWSKLLREAESRLRREGFEKPLFFDWATGARIEY